jgi:hypothetical protein
MKMLWYKAWREMKWRAALPLGMVLFALFQIHSHVKLDFRSDSGIPPVFWVIAPIMLGGSGIRTEPLLQPMKGLHGSVYFTLSLPVSRLRLFAVRAGAGLLAVATIIAAECGTAAIFFPEVRASATLAGGFAYAATIFLCGLVFYGLSTLLAVFLDVQWQTWIGLTAVFVFRWLRDIAALPRAFDPLRALGDLSPVVTHAFPWAAIGVSVALGAIFLLAAVKAVEMRQY